MRLKLNRNRMNIVKQAVYSETLLEIYFSLFWLKSFPARMPTNQKTFVLYFWQQFLIKT